jgi:Na+-driven multidrug efflux pump
MTDVLEIQTMIHTIMLTSCIAVPLFWPASFITPAIIRSSGDGKFTSVVSILSMITMRLTISYVLTHVFKIGVIGIWLGMYSDWLVRIAFFFPRFRSGKWLQFRVLDE